MPSKEMRALGRILEHAGVTLVLDIGANIGQYATRLRACGYRGRILSVEPLAEAHAALARAAAGDPNWQVAAPLALGDRPGEAVLNISAESDMSSLHCFTPAIGRLLDGAAFTGRQRVRVERLDAVWEDWVAPDDTVLLKIDVQGHEGAVLEGAAGVLDRIAAIQLELPLVPIYAGEATWRSLVDRLEALGFGPALFIPGYFNRRTARLVSMDGVFVRAAPDAPPARRRAAPGRAFRQTEHDPAQESVYTRCVTLCLRRSPPGPAFVYGMRWSCTAHQGVGHD